MGPHPAGDAPGRHRLNTLFVRYGCGTNSSSLRHRAARLNTLFVRYGCGTFTTAAQTGVVAVLIPYSSGMGVGRLACARRAVDSVLIPYSSGMGVGRRTGRSSAPGPSLNTLFVRYGCGTEFDQDRKEHALS